MTQVKRITRQTRVTIERNDGRDLTLNEAQAEAQDAIGAGWVPVDYERVNYDRLTIILEAA